MQYPLLATEFNSVLDEFFGRQVTRIPVTRAYSNVTGEETLTEGTSGTIKCYFVRTDQTFDFREYGFKEKGEALMLSKAADSVKKDDLITVDSVTFRVREAYGVPGTLDSAGSSSAFVYVCCNLFIER